MQLKAVISATSKEEAEEICDTLLEKELLAGTLIIDGDSRYHWRGEIKEELYYNIHAYTLDKHKKEVIEEVREIHSDETPIIEYHEIDGNQDFLDWIEKNVS
jgi:periplasmic divalent cation tolerance protein